MGADIHAYIDYDETSGTEVHTSNLAQVHIDRDYWLFTLMAGVRGTTVQGQMPVSQPKGLPSNLSWRVRRDAYLMVLDDEPSLGVVGCCSREEAEKWGNYVDQSKRYVHHPDWHSHTWLTFEEVGEVIRRYSTLKEKRQVWLQEHEAVPEGYTLLEEEWCGMRVAQNEGVQAQIPMELHAIYAMMSAVESAGHKCRLVAWFDN